MDRYHRVRRRPFQHGIESDVLRRGSATNLSSIRCCVACLSAGIAGVTGSALLGTIFDQCLSMKSGASLRRRPRVRSSEVAAETECRGMDISTGPSRFAETHLIISNGFKSFLLDLLVQPTKTSASNASRAAIEIGVVFVNRIVDRIRRRGGCCFFGRPRFFRRRHRERIDDRNSLLQSSAAILPLLHRQEKNSSTTGSTERTGSDSGVSSTNSAPSSSPNSAAMAPSEDRRLRAANHRPDPAVSPTSRRSPAGDRRGVSNSSRRAKNRIALPAEPSHVLALPLINRRIRVAKVFDAR